MGASITKPQHDQPKRLEHCHEPESSTAPPSAYGKRALITIPHHDQYKRLKHCQEPESSTAPHSAYGKPVSLNLGRKVFLSHSGKDKVFVRRLYRDLCSCYHGIEVAFFDEETLPKGEAISMEKSILEEARGSALGVLVLTDDFFMHTRNPMLELEAFATGNVDLLPLFLTMSVDQFKEEERWDRWEKKWKEWAAADEKLVIQNWRSYLKFVRTYNGLEFCKIAPDGRWDLYIDEVVKQVARIIGPTVPMSGEDVYGKVRLCQMVEDMYKKCTSKRSPPIDRTPTQIASASASLGLGENSGLCAYDVVGIHGFPGLGKTTLCKCLCDFYFGELNGKVCYIDLGSSLVSRLSRMQHVLSRLDRGNTKDIHNLQLDSNQVEYLLKKRLSSMKDPVFLAIDNVLQERESQEEAFIYLRFEFPKGSKILITSRSESIIRNLTSLLHSCSFSAVIEYMPALKLEEARNIFEHDFPDLHNHLRYNAPAIEKKLQKDVDACVSECTIFSRKRYHPLMVKSLAAFVRWDRSTPSLDWQGRLAKLASEGIVRKDDALEQVFEVFEITYGLLPEKAKKMFLDLTLCYSATAGNSIMYDMDYYEWIKMLHSTHLSNRKTEKILFQLQDLCFIGQLDLSNIRMKGHTIEIQDLMVDFGKHKLAGADSDGYVVLEDSAHWPYALPRTARHVSISKCRKALRTLDLRDVEGVTVLHLLDNAGLEEVVLSRTSSAHLCSVMVSVPARNVLRFIVNEDWTSQSLKWLKLEGNINFYFQPSQHPLVLPAARMDPGSMFLGGFQNLELLSLDSALPSTVQSIDVTPCTNLKTLIVCNLPGLKSIRVPESSLRLERVTFLDLPHLEESAFTISADSKMHAAISYCKSLRRVSLCTTSSISCAGAAESESDLSILCCPLLTNVDGLSQYAGSFDIYFDPPESEGQRYRFWGETFVNMVKDAGIDSSQSKAVVTEMEIDGYSPAGLGGVRALCLEDAQHIGPLISAMFQAQPAYLRQLKIWCQQAGDGTCGCDKNAPNFDTYSRRDNTTSSQALDPPEFEYCCPQVRDLASLAQWHRLCRLILKGCTSVEKWPDFTAMTSLVCLDLSNTSLKEWLVGVHLLPRLSFLDLRGCQQLPAKEFILGAITPDCHSERKMFGSAYICNRALASLREDLSNGTRDRCTVADALDALSQELAALFDRWLPDSGPEKVIWVILEIMYDVWFGGGGSDVEEQKLYMKMRRLLSSESFLSLPFRLCSQSSLSKYRISQPLGTMAATAVIGVLGITLVGRASLAYSYHALPAVNDHHLRDSTIIFFKKKFCSLIESIKTPCIDSYHRPLTDEAKEVLRERMGVVLCMMAREAGLEVEERDTESEPDPMDSFSD